MAPSTEKQHQNMELGGKPDEFYDFPMGRLRRQRDPCKIPMVLVVCGSFSPITIMHLRMCEMAADWVRMVEDDYEVVAIYLSPVSDAYKKKNLAEAKHRIRMCELAIRDSETCIMVDPWEANQPQYIPTADVLDHFKHEINDVIGGIIDAHGVRRKARVALLAGADLLQTMSTPGVWSPADLDRILGDGGIYVIERYGTDIEEARSKLSHYAENIYPVPQGVPIDLSSTKVRLFLSRNMSVRYFVPNSVIDYIMDRGLYDAGRDPLPEAQEGDGARNQEQTVAGPSNCSSGHG